MRALRKAAERERQVPLLWFALLLVLTGSSLVYLIYHQSPWAALLVGGLVLVGGLAPWAALHSLRPPRRPTKAPPPPGQGSFSDWLEQVHALGRLLLYYEDNPDLPAEIQAALRRGREDLRDTLRAHPLRDDLERLCQRLRSGPIEEVKSWFARTYHPDLRVIANEYEQAASRQLDENDRLQRLQDAVEKAADLMTHRCMPRMLENERLHCAQQCAWLAVQAAAVHLGRVSPVELSEMLVIEWCDFSMPWQPAAALQEAWRRLQVLTAVELVQPADPPAGSPAPALAAPDASPASAEGEIVIRNGRRYRRVRVRRRRRRNHSHNPSLVDLVLTFGQWLRYSVRAWWLYP